MTPFDRAARVGSTLAPAAPGGLVRRHWLRPAVLIALVALVAVGCGVDGAEAVLPVPNPLVPAPLTPDPWGLITWIYTPIFQGLLLILFAFEQITPDVGLAIIGMTIVVRTLLVPLIRRQMVSTRRIQMIAPEVKELQKRYKGDRVKQQQEVSALYKERGISQFGCMAMILPLLIIIPMYTVINQGLRSPDPTPMLHVAGIELISVDCAGGDAPCVDTTVPWLGGLDASIPSTIDIFGFGLSLLAVVYTVIQLMASRMALPPHDPANTDPNIRIQRQTMLLLPFMTILWGGIIPAGLYIYLIVSTIYQVIQQYLITGWGGMFPLFGWTPAFAIGHTPRFPVAMPVAVATQRAAGASAPQTSVRSTAASRAASAARTTRPAQRGRQGRRGRKR